MCFAVEFNRSFLNASFCTGPSIVRLGLLIAARQPGGGFGGRNRLNGNVVPHCRRAVSARGRHHTRQRVAELRHERWSVMNSSTSLPHLTVRYSGSPAHDGSCGSPVSRIGSPRGTPGGRPRNGPDPPSGRRSRSRPRGRPSARTSSRLLSSVRLEYVRLRLYASRYSVSVIAGPRAVARVRVDRVAEVDEEVGVLVLGGGQRLPVVERVDAVRP